MINRATHVFAAIAIMALAAVQGLSAQTVSYARKSGEVLRFHDVIRIEGTARGRAGDIRTDIAREGILAIRFVMGDSAVAWYDSLSAQATGPVSRREDTTTRVLKAPFTLQVEGDGTVTTLASPELTTLVRELAQYTPQFDDFFPRLPSAMTPGSNRVDTIVRTQQAGDTRRLLVRRIVVYKVEHDTVFAGRTAYRVTATADVRIDASAPLRDDPAGLTVSLRGTESGSALVTQSGYLLSRDRTGAVGGIVTYTSGGARVDVAQTYRYTGMTTARNPGR